MKISRGRPYPLGATIQDRKINFAAVLQSKEECGVILYPKKGGEEIRLPFEKSNRVGNIYCLEVTGISSREYTYNFYCGKKILTDPLAKVVYGNEKWGEKISPQLSAGLPELSFDWEEDKPLLTPYEDSILYLLHVRGFTKHVSSGVKKKGTFRGIAEKIPYFKELGITALELMPAYEFLELERPKSREMTLSQVMNSYKENLQEDSVKLNYWGFKNAYYFAPKASYAATARPDVEFKEMVKELHKNGIEVIMQFYFPNEVKGATILEVIKYWVCEYHIDGAHLMGERIPTALLATEPLLANTKLFYYDFPCGEIYENDKAPEYKNLASYKDDFMYAMRRFLKGDEDTMTGVLYHQKNNPLQTGVINYITNYSGFTLADLVSYERKHNEGNGEEDRDGNPYNESWNCGCEGKTRKKTVLALREKQVRNALVLLLGAQGTPMILSGDEFGNSQEGNNNPYCQDNAVSWLNWGDLKKNQQLFDFVKELIAFRKAHPILHRPEEFTMMDYIACGYPDLSYHEEEAWRLKADRLCRTVGIMYCGNYAKISRTENDCFIYMAYNMHWEDHELALPGLPGDMEWIKVLDTAETAMETKKLKSQKFAAVESRSIQILISQKIPEKKGK